MEALKSLKEKIETVQQKILAAERAHDLSRVADLRCVLPAQCRGTLFGTNVVRLQLWSPARLEASPGVE